MGAAGIAFLEELRSDAAAFGGIDAQQPMKRAQFCKVRAAEAQEDDF